MSVVYKASHLTLGRPVALKVLNRHLLSGGSATERFQREALAVSTLDHPNIVKIFGVGKVADAPYMAMEMLEGESLAELLKREGRLSTERAIPLFCQLLDALAHAHERSIVHRDLKPSNVFICSATHNVKLLDFGIAKINAGTTDGAQKLTATGEIFGTLSYMSPEQCTGGKVDHRSDIYSMACLMYEVLDGKQPFRADTPYGVLSKQTLGQVPASTFIQGALGDVILAALAKDPDNRPQSAAELKQLLLEPQSLTLKGSRSEPKISPRQIAVISLLLVGTALAALVGVKFFQKQPSVQMETATRHATKSSSASQALVRLSMVGSEAVSANKREMTDALAEIDGIVASKKCSRIQEYSAYYIRHYIERRLGYTSNAMLPTLYKSLPYTYERDGKPTNETGLVQMELARYLLSNNQVDKASAMIEDTIKTYLTKDIKNLEIPASLKLVKGIPRVRDAYMIQSSVLSAQGKNDEALKQVDLAIKNSTPNPYWRFDATQLKIELLNKMKRHDDIEEVIKNDMSESEAFLRHPSANPHDMRYAIKNFEHCGNSAAKYGFFDLAKSAFEKQRDLALEIGDNNEQVRKAQESLSRLARQTKTGRKDGVTLYPEVQS